MNLKLSFPRLFQLYENTENDYLGLIAAGIAFYFLMAAFPALAAAISLYGIFSDPHFVNDQIDQLSRFLPKEAIAIFADQAKSLTAASQQVLSLSFFISIILAIYSSGKSVGALIKGLNIAYNEKEKRGFFVLSITGFVLTAGLMVYLLLALTLIAVVPAIVNIVRLPEMTSQVYLLVRWPLLYFTALFGIQVLYAFAPSRTKIKWEWISWGGVAATTLWLGASSFFSLFVTYFGNYNETYGSISAIIILLLWFWITAMTILLGAEINHVFDGREAGRPKAELNLKDGS